MYRLLAPSNPAGRVVHDARRRDLDLGREQAVPGTPAARTKYVAGRERPAFAPDPEHDQDDSCDQAAEDPLDRLVLRDRYQIHDP